MTNESGTFSPIGNSDTRMYGDTALLVSGYPAAEQTSLRELLSANALGHIPIVFVTDDYAGLTPAELATLPDGHGEGVPSGLRRGIVMSGLSENELHRLMSAYRRSGMAPQHWASVTPTSERWPIGTLLDELAREQQALKNAVKKGRGT